MSTLRIKDLHVSVETAEGPKEILKGVNLTINSGEIHAIMGPNGSGKSTMAYALAGHPDYEITSGEAWLDDQLITEMSVDERAKAGLFLAMQYPVEVAGVSVSNFLRTAKTAIDGQAPALRSWVKEMKTSMENLRMDPDFAERDVNVGFSGGEKKRLEILQMELLKPSFTLRAMKSGSISRFFMASLTSLVQVRREGALPSTAVLAERRKLDMVTPGISTGYCIARNRPARARSSTLISVMSSPSSRI